MGIAVLLAWLAGCGAAEHENQPGQVLNVPHVHAEKGPHGGMLIELGNEEFHAELLHNEVTNLVTIYLLDGSAKNPVAIEAPQISVNVRLGDAGQQFFLTAESADGDPAGTSSRFTSQEAALAEALHHDDAQSQLVLTIQGKQFRGAIAHDHPHDHRH
jgi:hypothetical protein